jgi:hypothetical protein
MTRFYVYFKGSTNGRVISAASPKAAMAEFAKLEGVTVSSYITYSRNIPGYAA